jgi:hypothetical protein
MPNSVNISCLHRPFEKDGCLADAMENRANCSSYARLGYTAREENRPANDGLFGLSHTSGKRNVHYMRP